MSSINWTNTSIPISPFSNILSPTYLNVSAYKSTNPVRTFVFGGAYESVRGGLRSIGACATPTSTF